MGGTKAAVQRRDGGLRIVRGLVTPEAARAERGAAKKAGFVGTSGTLLPALSDVLVDELASIRTVALRIELARRPDLALAAIVQSLAAAFFCPASTSHDGALQIRLTSTGLAERVGDAGQTTALAAWDTERDAWGERLPGEPGAVWEWCAAQERDTLLELLAFLGAASLNAVKQRHERADSDRLVYADRLAAATGLDMCAHWAADAAFFR